MKALPLLALVPLVPVRFCLWAGTILLAYLLVTVAVLLFFRALSRHNERL